MFEIGNSLREARLRQGLDLARAESDTKIRTKYLNALEEERFEVLPGETYVKGFLRTYADYLGLDGQLYVDEYNSRFSSGEDAFVPVAAAARRRSPPLERNLVVVALAAIVAVTLLVVVAWRVGTNGEEPPPLPNAGSAVEGPPAAPAGGTKTAARKRALPVVARLVVRAVRGDCWLEVHAGSPTGELLYQGTLEQGQRLRFARKRLWMVVGAGGNVNARLNGQSVALPSNVSVVVTPRGVRAQR